MVWRLPFDDGQRCVAIYSAERLLCFGCLFIIHRDRSTRLIDVADTHDAIHEANTEISKIHILWRRNSTNACDGMR